MHIREIFNAQRTTFSFEFFPPKSIEAADALFATIADLEQLRPTFVSAGQCGCGADRRVFIVFVLGVREGDFSGQREESACGWTGRTV